MLIKAIEEMESFPAGENPFWHDLYHMGADVTKDIMAMFDELEGNRYLIIVNKKTGERIKLWLDLEETPRMGSFRSGLFDESAAPFPMVTRRETLKWI
jgi:hypothetical protein